MKTNIGNLRQSLNNTTLAKAIASGYVAVRIDTEVIHVQPMYKDSYTDKWINCALGQATRVFFKHGPNAYDKKNNVATYYPNTGLFWENPQSNAVHTRAALKVISQITDRFATDSKQFEILSIDPSARVHAPERDEVLESLATFVPVENDEHREHVSDDSVKRLRSLLAATA